MMLRIVCRYNSVSSRTVASVCDDEVQMLLKLVISVKV